MSRAQKIAAWQCGTAVASAAVGLMDVSWWWIPVIPWAILCIIGIAIMIGFWIVAGILTAGGGAQADWMSDVFVIIVFCIAPTVFSVIATFWIDRRIRFVRTNNEDPSEALSEHPDKANKSE